MDVDVTALDLHEMRQKSILLFLIINTHVVFSQNDQYYQFVKPVEDSVFILFNVEDSKFSIERLGGEDPNPGHDYVIKMEIGIDLRFTDNYYPSDIYQSTISFDSMAQLDVKDYWWLYHNYQDSNRDRLLQKLNWDQTDFYLVLPDSCQKTATLYRVFNRNNTEY